MLVLTRNVGEMTEIRCPCGCEVVVMVTRLDRDQVRLGFIADKSISIVRTEAIEREQERGGDKR